MSDGLYELKRRDYGTDVLRLQSFLIASGVNLQFGADGDFGADTERGVKSFQSTHGLPPTGEFDKATIPIALTTGYSNTRFPPGLHPQTNTYPKRPNDLSSPDSTTAISLFGEFSFRSANDPNNPERIIVDGDWVQNNITDQIIPQLKGMVDLRTGSPRIMTTGKIRCHRLAAPKILELFDEWEKAGLMDRVLYYVGCYSARLKRGRTKFTTSNLSNHSWGSAIDINSRENWLGSVPSLYGVRGCVRELVEIANSIGFYWGGHYTNRKDGMHFELARL